MLPRIRKVQWSQVLFSALVSSPTTVFVSVMRAKDAKAASVGELSTVLWTSSCTKAVAAALSMSVQAISAGLLSVLAVAGTAGADRLSAAAALR